MAIDFIGHCTINVIKALKYIFSGRVNIKNTLIQCSMIGYDSLLIVMIIALASGAVLALQVSKQFVMSGADSYIGGLIAAAILREMGPIFASLAVGARAGTAIAAEIGNMKVTEQVDALTVLKVDPIEYLMVPRFIAGVVMVPLLTIMAQTIGILGGMFISWAVIGLHFTKYLTSVWLYMNMFDIKISLIKAAVFGGLISTICCTHGLLTNGGAKEVGISTTKAAIWTAIAVLITDYMMTWMFY